MTRLIATSKDEIIRILHSVDDSLVFSCRKSLFDGMKSIGFIELNELTKISTHCDYYQFKGLLDNQAIQLSFVFYKKNETYSLYQKQYVVLGNDENKLNGTHLHREGDLPALMGYDYHTGELVSFSFLINGEYKRINDSGDLLTSYVYSKHSNLKTYSYSPDVNNPAIFCLTHVSMVNDKIDKAQFMLKGKIIDLFALSAILPYVEEFSHHDLKLLSTTLSSDEFSLLEMAFF